VTATDSPPTIHIGVIADTHGKLAPKALQALKGVELIVHAGDVQSITTLDQLSRIAPVKAVRGNMDRGHGVKNLPATEVVQVGETQLYVLHNLETLDIHPAAAGFDAVIYGHSHQPENKIRNGVLFLNPGSPSSPRRGSPPTVARLLIQGKILRAELIELGN
jgi:putative phosphoesterase